MPEWTDKERTSFLATASARLLSSGITSVGDAAVDPPSIDFFKAQDEQGKLPLRIYTMMDCSAAQAEKTGCLDRVPFVPEKSGGRLTARAIKLFADGALGSWGSAMWDPYEDKPHESGLLLMPEEEIEPTIRGWMDKGFQVAVRE
jgi:predicted amidohydrolase YtcJ